MRRHTLESFHQMRVNRSDDLDAPVLKSAPLSSRKVSTERRPRQLVPVKNGGSVPAVAQVGLGLCKDGTRISTVLFEASDELEMLPIYATYGY